MGGSFGLCRRRNGTASICAGPVAEKPEEPKAEKDAEEGTQGDRKGPESAEHSDQHCGKPEATGQHFGGGPRVGKTPLFLARQEQ
eukprot:CAMPEP_0171471398 /NCGR_PEP_ID=MMETSP0946-20130122/680_1 /TAXON_ID=109269 /ORGANISM="Vaucheria litorea, Strain CCMP2940" /LENGTH=84 /DNA_ID=CAMNT_0012000879 /DNA_START=122 /DNA_END=376 /DNA_ORIENTATION=-